MKHRYICLPALFSLMAFTISAYGALPVQEKKILTTPRGASLSGLAGPYYGELAQLRASFSFEHEHNERLFNLGVSYLKMNRPALAASLFEGLVAKDVLDTEAYNLLGIAYIGCGRKQDAIAVWKKSLLIDPSQKIPRKFIEEAGG